jgi:hypothetical protein
LKKAAWMLIVGALMWPIGAFGLFPIVGDTYSGATEEVRRSAIQSHGAIWALQQLIFLSGAVLVGFGEVRLERLYRDRHKHRRGGFAKAMVGFMGVGLIGFTVSAVTFILGSVSPVDNPLLIYWKLATWCIVASFGFLSLLHIGKNIATSVVSVVCMGWVLLSAYSFWQMGRSFPPLLLFLVPLVMGLRLVMQTKELNESV